LEDFLLENPEVLEAAVVPGPDPGAEVYAFIVPRSGVFNPVRLELNFQCKVRSYGLKGSIEYRSSLPKNGTGKLYRRELMKKAACWQS
jgi:acyl-coenzyme A synthetase/AMP-(fatty) acid ligase